MDTIGTVFKAELEVFSIQDDFYLRFRFEEPAGYITVINGSNLGTPQDGSVAKNVKITMNDRLSVEEDLLVASVDENKNIDAAEMQDKDYSIEIIPDNFFDGSTTLRPVLFNPVTFQLIDIFILFTGYNKCMLRIDRFVIFTCDQNKCVF